MDELGKKYFNFVVLFNTIHIFVSPTLKLTMYSTNDLNCCGKGLLCLMSYHLTINVSCGFIQKCDSKFPTNIQHIYVVCIFSVMFLIH